MSLLEQLRASIPYEQAKQTNVVAINPRAVIGDNHAPGCIDTARGVYITLMTFLKEVPVIQSHDEAKKGANLVEQARATLGEMEDERKAFVKPINDAVKEINDRYRSPVESVKAIMDELKRRLTAFAQAEEAERLRKADLARLAAEEAERIAREAEAREREAKEDVDCGVVGVNAAAAIIEADRACDGFKRADREANRAERETTVRLNGGFGRAVSMRSKETLTVVDAVAAISALGLTEAISDAIITSARAFRKLRGALPAGVSAVTERQF